MPTAATIAIAQDKVTDRLDKAMRKLAKKHELDVAELPYERNADLARIAELERIADLLDGVIKSEKHADDDAGTSEEIPGVAYVFDSDAAYARYLNDERHGGDDDKTAFEDAMENSWNETPLYVESEASDDAPATSNDSTNDTGNDADAAAVTDTGTDAPATDSSGADAAQAATVEQQPPAPQPPVSAPARGRAGRNK